MSEITINKANPALFIPGEDHPNITRYYEERGDTENIEIAAFVAETYNDEDAHVDLTLAMPGRSNVVAVEKVPHTRHASDGQSCWKKAAT